LVYLERITEGKRRREARMNGKEGLDERVMDSEKITIVRLMYKERDLIQGNLIQRIA